MLLSNLILGCAKMSESSAKKSTTEGTLAKKRVVSFTAATRTKPLHKPASLTELGEADRSLKDGSKSATVHKLEREVKVVLNWPDTQLAVL